MSAVYEALSTSLETSVLFPQIRTLVVTKTGYPTLVQRLLGPRLSTFVHPVCMSRPLCAKVIDAAREIKHLRLFSESCAFRTEEICNEMICGMNNLVEVDLEWMVLSRNAIHHLLSLPNLCRLHVANHASDVLSAMSPNHGEAGLLSSLTWLTLHSGDFESINSCARLVGQMPNLEFLNLVPGLDLATASQLHDIFCMLEKTCSKDGFQSFQTADADVYELNEDQESLYMLSGSVLAPLYSFHRLTTLILWNHPFMLDDAMVTEMATAWPLIEVLRLGADENNKKSFVTLNGLISLISSCRVLTSLGLVLDFSIRCYPRWASEAISSSVENLYIGWSTFDDNSAETAVLLSCIFPKLEVFEYSDGKWEDVEDLMSITFGFE